MGHGEYVHFNWIVALKEYIKKFHKNKGTINLLANIDGLPLFANTRKYTAYPILVKIMSTESNEPKKVFCCGIYCSNSTTKTGMPEPNTLLNQFFKDLDELQNFTLDDHTYTVKLRTFCCDAPVRASLKNIVSHGGYNACERCEQHGKYHGAVVLLKTESKLRSDNSFINREDPAHHKGVSFLEQFNFPMVTGFVIDYMHASCIGTMKRILMRLVFRNKRGKKVKLSKKCIEKIDKKIDMVRHHIPMDFNRKLEGGVTNLKHWKASEFRLFALYVGVFVLSFKKILDPKFFVNYLSFAVAMKLLLTDDQSVNLDAIKTLMKNFVRKSSKLYGKSFVSYNIHNMIHLADDYETYGNLEYISSFPFESYLGSEIKGCIRSGYKPLQQIASYIDRSNRNIPPIPTMTITLLSPVKKRCSHEMEGSCYRKVKLANGTILSVDSKNTRDSCIQLKTGEIALLSAIHEGDSSVKFFVNCFKTKLDYFIEPMPSSAVGIFVVCDLGLWKWVSVDDFSTKLFAVPYKQRYIVQIMPHTRMY